MGKAEVMKLKGWFTTPTRDGDRTIEQQMTGLDQLMREAAGKSVIDAGCAEALISIELVKAGAVHVVGLEIVAAHVAIARDLVVGMPIDIVEANLNHFKVAALDAVDVVIMLAILHKLKEPAAVCAALAGLAKDLVVIRLPPSGPVIVDDRSNRVPQDIPATMEAAGFALESVVEGPMSEWLGYFRRVTPGADKPETKVYSDSAFVDTQAPVDDDVISAATKSELIAAAVETKVEASETDAAVGETKVGADETQGGVGDAPRRARRAKKAELGQE